MFFLLLERTSVEKSEEVQYGRAEIGNSLGAQGLENFTLAPVKRKTPLNAIFLPPRSNGVRR